MSLFVFEQGDDFSVEPPLPTLGPLSATPTDPLDPLSPLASDEEAIQSIVLRQYNAAQEVIADGIIVRNVCGIQGGCIPPAESTGLACYESAAFNNEN